MPSGGGTRRATPPPKAASRARQRGEHGLTLLEVLITIALLALGFVGITAGIAQAEHVSTIDQNQSQLEVAERQLADFVRDSNPARGLAYSSCATVTAPVSAAAPGVSTYTAQLPAKPSGVAQWGISAIYESPTSPAGGNLDGSATAPMTKSGCPAGSGDWGVQEIVVSVFEGNQSLSRTVWKSFAWCYQGTSAC